MKAANERANSMGMYSYHSQENILNTKYSLFWEEICACAAVHTRYVMDVCDHVRPIILLPPMMGTSFVLAVLTRLIVSKPKHRVT